MPDVDHPTNAKKVKKADIISNTTITVSVWFMLFNVFEICSSTAVLLGFFSTIILDV